ncbi:myb/SANT-like DNA-binding domain-containing protein 7 isoform X2 [Monodelphis domestica]|uniref:myb/SANT-like DNA-binding domain-containing protein 7 isoform X2 n=1 Tax=Monodelphis domestica TaxID=13616 RepID=UPI0024E26107|nr:myb/SANT-like DNA-binding domain-containing protein 7 isoform X2 [Monodelphis domestica]XP_056674370.1 myb/SANT-like DNA-binding domain-containing protein 7 isoform X2 [Monodelphis domestica]XP_056674371.1 myb/SANT-like DNA-binding domain-containing protein 7 isoform X2 [Monodelphis domestica]XP_056674372.1 myb/SANT-like DNA-binding domain-containing protein 7 isoform X2 [Monodelphis domestica]
MASAPIPRSQQPGGPSQYFQQDPAGVHWAPAEIQHLLAIMEEPAIRRRLKTVHRNTSVYEDVARRLQERGYVRHAHQCRTKFKALKVAYKKARAAGLHSGVAPRGCPFYEEMDRVLQTPITPASPSDPLQQKQEPRGEMNYSKWQCGGGRNKGEQGETMQECPPAFQRRQRQQQQCGSEAEHEDFKGKMAERPRDLNPDSQAGAQGGKDQRETSHQPGTGFHRKLDQNLPQRKTSPTTTPPAPVVTTALSGGPPGQICQFPPRIHNFRRHQMATPMMATEMAEIRRLAIQLAQESATQLQHHLDQHNAHMAALVQVARDSYAQRQEVAALLQDVADDIHEGLALLRSSVGRLGQE